MSVSTQCKLTDPQRYMLWTVAQHKYGWSHASRRGGGLQVAAALVRRGLVEWVEPHNGPDSHAPEIKVTEQGRAEIKRRWPISPLVLGTYEPQPGGWTQPDGTQRISKEPTDAA